MKGLKFDGDKLKWSLIPWQALAEVVKVLMYGEKKYTQVVDGKEISGADNWKLVENPQVRYWNAAMRHMIAHRNGELRDPETGLLHMAHAGCCVLFLIWDTLVHSSEGEPDVYQMPNGAVMARIGAGGGGVGRANVATGSNGLGSENPKKQL